MIDDLEDLLEGVEISKEMKYNREEETKVS